MKETQEEDSECLRTMFSTYVNRNVDRNLGSHSPTIPLVFDIMKNVLFKVRVFENHFLGLKA